MRDHEAVSGRQRLRVLRAVTGALAVAAAVTGIGTAAAGGGSAKQGLITNVTTVAPDNAAAAVIATARQHVGDKYVYGADGPSTWDCSGFTSWLWRSVGGVSSIPRTARLQQAWVTPVPPSQVLPGDLYFVGMPATHVGIVLGAGMVIDASASHGSVLVRQLWTATDITFGRVPRPGAVPVTAVATTAPPTAPATTAPATSAPPTAPTTAPVTSAPATTTAPATAPATTPPVTPPPVAAGNAAGSFFVPSPASLVSAAGSLVGARYATGGVGPRYDDAALFAAAWHRAGGGSLPLDRNALAARARTVPDSKLRVGDLVVYGAANKVWHVGMYVGKGMMVDASAIKGHVVLRPVFTSTDRRFGRLH
jgi:cell wall-associated NlpC family hydrolase